MPKSSDKPAEVIAQYDDEPLEDGSDRYAIYSVSGGLAGNRERRRLCMTSRDGLGLALLTMLGLNPEGEADTESPAEIERGDAVGIFDRKERAWLINPFVNIR